MDLTDEEINLGKREINFQHKLHAAIDESLEEEDDVKIAKQKLAKVSWAVFLQLCQQNKEDTMKDLEDYGLEKLTAKNFYASVIFARTHRLSKGKNISLFLFF